MFHPFLVDAKYRMQMMIQAAANLGLDGGALRTCVENKTHENTVRFDLERGRELGLNGTPTFFVNGQRIFEFRQLIETIDSEIARAGL